MIKISVLLAALLVVMGPLRAAGAPTQSRRGHAVRHRLASGGALLLHVRRMPRRASVSTGRFSKFTHP